MKIRIVCLLILLSGAVGFAADPKMNDISLYQFGDFTQEWKLVTVRYRKDTEEMRFTYANPKAWEALKKQSLPFPDGSIFAKVGFKSKQDPAFNSSVVPSGARRFQFMVKDSKKYSEFDGWGYALFQSNGELYEGDLKTQTFSCHACHKIVPERNFVFSERVEISPFVKKLQTVTLSKKMLFVEIQTKNFQSKLKNILNKKKISRLHVVDGEIRKHYFGGTLDEITPTLIHELERNLDQKNFGVGFVSSDNLTFKIVKLNSAQCSNGEISILIFESRLERPELVEMESCYLTASASK
jgi:hypothetical protein